MATRRVRHADVQPHIGLRSEQVCLLQVDRRRRVARVLLVDVVASGVGNQPHGIVFRRGHEPRIAVGRIEHDRRGIENGTGHFLFQRIVSDRNIREYLFALRAFPDDLRKRHQPFGFAQRRFFEIIADIHERDAELLEFALHRTGPVHAEKQHKVRVERQQKFIIDISLVTHVADAVAACLNVGIGDIVESRNADHTCRLADGVEHGDMGRGHRHDALRIPFEDLPVETLGNGFPVTGDEQPGGDAIRALPRIHDGNQHALSAVCSFNLESRGIFGSVKLFVEIGKLGTLATTACKCQRKQHHQAQIL